MKIRFWTFIILVNVVGYVLMIPSYWIAYFLRKPVRYLNKQSLFTRIISFPLWMMLHDDLSTGLPCDYGDEKWLESKLKGRKRKWWRMFIISYKWVLRNPLHNLYYTLRTQGKEENYIDVREPENPDITLKWRTFTTFNEKMEPAGRNGVYVDFKNSLFGKQNIRFDIVSDKKSRQAFRKSTCIPFKLFGNIWIHSRRAGYENNLPQISFNLHRCKNNEYNNDGFNAWKKSQ